MSRVMAPLPSLSPPSPLSLINGFRKSHPAAAAKSAEERRRRRRRGGGERESSSLSYGTNITRCCLLLLLLGQLGSSPPLPPLPSAKGQGRGRGKKKNFASKVISSSSPCPPSSRCYRASCPYFSPPHTFNEKRGGCLQLCPLLPPPPRITKYLLEHRFDR